MRIARLVLAFALLAFGGHIALQPARAAEALTAAQKDEVKKLVHDYIMDNPGIIGEAMNAMEAKNDQAKIEKRASVVLSRRQELLNPAEGTILGNPKGDVTVTEFFDYNCGYCKQMFPSVVELLKEDPEIRLVMKEYPILGPGSLTASRAALAARKQGKWSEFHLALMGYKGAISDSIIMVIAQNVGLDTKKLQEDMKDTAITDVLIKNHSLADELAIDGTPQVIIGNNFLPGAVAKEELVAAIAAARK